VRIRVGERRMVGVTRLAAIRERRGGADSTRSAFRPLPVARIIIETKEERILRLLNHFVGAGQQKGGYRQPQRIGSPEVYEHFKFAWLFHGKVARFGTFQYLVDVDGRSTTNFAQIGPIRKQRTTFKSLPRRSDRRQFACKRQFGNYG